MVICNSFFNVYLFVLREREIEHRAGAERERIPSRLHAVSADPHVGLKPTNHEIMTRAKIKSQTLNRLSHPRDPGAL